MLNSEEAIKFFETLLEEEIDSIKFTGYTVFTHPSHTHPPKLKNILFSLDNTISNIAYSALEYLEKYEIESNDFQSFKWRVLAFIEIQDIFDIPIYKDIEDPLSGYLWYFYYESKYILTESILCGLNGLYYSAETILRGFLEFSVLQNYYYLKCKNKSSYEDVNRYFETDIKPKWSTLLRGAFPERSPEIPIETIKRRILSHYDALSEKCSHAHHESFSQKSMNYISTPKHSVLGLRTFWRIVDFVLEAVLWMYYLNFPMLLQPKNIIKKFGFNAPLGIFIDSSRGHAIKNSLKIEDFYLFQKYSDNNENVKELNNWFDQHADLSLEEIKETWPKIDNYEFPKNLENAILANTTKIRAWRECAALKSNPKNPYDFEYPKFDFTIQSFDKFFKANKKI